MRKKRIIFLPGTLCTANVFVPQLARCSRAGWEMFMWDYGDFRKWDAWAEDALSRMPPRFALAGLSLGGIAAMEIVRRAPERVTHLALLDTNLGGETEKSGLRRALDLARARRIGLSRFVAEEMIGRQLHPDNAGDSMMREILLTMARKTGMRQWRAQLALLSDRTDARPLLPSLRMPVLVGCGDSDGVCPPELHRDMAEMIPNATLKIFPRCGHLSTLEAADAVSDELMKLLDA